MAPQTPAYRAVPSSPPSAHSTPSTLVDSTASTPFIATERRGSGSGASPELKSSARSLFSSPLPKRFRLRPLHIVLGLLGVVLLGPVLHPSSRSAVRTYLTTQPSTPHIQPPTGGLDPALVPLKLEARLSYLLALPALDHDKADMPSRYNCPMYTYNRNYYFFHDQKQEMWERLNGGDVMRYRGRMVDHLKTVEREGGKLVWEKGMDDHIPKDQRRGLIFTAGDGPALERLKLTLHMLRRVIKSRIHTHIYFFRGELEDVGMREWFEREFDVKFIEVGGRRQDGKSWNIKTIAFLNTQFTEFVYMDSDNIPLADPAELFESIEYQQSGSVFWSDLNKDHPDNAIWRVLGRPCSDEHWPAEAGQIVFDKRANNGLNLAVLHLANHMMAAEDLYGFLGYGDKDTFRYSFYALGLDYQMASHQFASAGGFQNGQGVDSEAFCGHTMLQWGLTPQSARNDPTFHPRPMFLHTILAKHSYGLQPAKLFTHYRRPRLDRMSEPALIRAYYEWTGACFAIDLRGPNGQDYGDGQWVDTLSLEELVADKEVYGGLQEISKTFVGIEH